MDDKTFEKWWGRFLAAAVPLFLGYLAYQDQAADHKIDNSIIVVLLAAYGAGVAGVVIRRMYGGNGK